MNRLQEIIKASIKAQQGWIAFDEFMHQALYQFELGYYTGGKTVLGLGPESGSDFVTAPLMSPLFGRAIAVVLAQALAATQTEEIWEFGAGNGALAEQIMAELFHLGVVLKRYCIVEVSGSLAARQKERLANASYPVEWRTALPDSLAAVVIGNEVLDAMPFKIFHRSKDECGKHGQWQERGVAYQSEGDRFVWSDKPAAWQAPLSIAGTGEYTTEDQPQAQAFIKTLAHHMERGAAFFIDYGFPEKEYYHEQRSMGTLMCHQGHLADTDPLSDVGQKDITTHLNFTALALAAQEAGLEVLGYTSQAHFLLNAGLAECMANSTLEVRGMALKLINEHEMGELFKVLGLVKGDWFDCLGFAKGDRSHRL